MSARAELSAMYGAAYKRSPLLQRAFGNNNGFLITTFNPNTKGYFLTEMTVEPARNLGVPLLEASLRHAKAVEAGQLIAGKEFTLTHLADMQTVFEDRVLVGNVDEQLSAVLLMSLHK